MSNSTRRGFLSMAAAAGAAAGAVAIGANSRVSNGAAAPAAPTPEETGPATEGSLVAYVHDLSAGEVTFMLEGHEVVVQDRALVAKLAKASASNRA